MRTAIVLEPLTDAETDVLLDELAQEWPLDADARARIKEAAEGNPLYVEQMAAMLAEGGPADSIPPSIHALLAARLDRLPADERAVLERAAVAGKEFVRSAVVQLSSDAQRMDVDAKLLSLARKDLLSARPGREDAYRFRHALIRDAAYAGIPKELRAASTSDSPDRRSALPGSRRRARRDRRLSLRAGVSPPRAAQAGRRGGSRAVAAGCRNPRQSRATRVRA